MFKVQLEQAVQYNFMLYKTKRDSTTNESFPSSKTNVICIYEREIKKIYSIYSMV